MKHNLITRRQFIGSGAAGILATTLGRPAWASPSGKRPNVLIITTDQQRVDAMSALGNKWAKTPNMDAIAAQGVYFRASYCPYPLCSPSRSALHTSRMSHEIGVDHNDMAINPAIPLSGQVFRAAGYETAYTGKWHCPDTYPTDGIDGFEVLNKTSRKGKLAHDVDEATMNEAIHFIQRKHEKPFYLVTSFINPHDICLLAGETSPLVGELEKKDFPSAGAVTPPLPANLANPQKEWAGVTRSNRHADWDEKHWRQYSYAYCRLIEDVDQQVGQVLQALRTAGHEENTLIIFTSDHGEGLGSHHRTGKMMYYEEEAAVPLIVSWKGVTPAGRLDQEHLVSGLDVLPTICDYAGVQGPAVMRGRSLRGVIETPAEAGHEYVVAEMSPGAGHGARSFMVRTKRYKYMVFPDGEQRAEMFFDMQADPGEMKNLAGETAVAPELERHRKLLAEWNKLTGEDQCPIKPNPAAGRGAKRAARAQRAKR